MRLIVVSIMVTLLSGCGSIISRTIPGQGHGTNIIPVCNGMCVTPPGVMSQSLICHSPWFLILYCCRSTFIMARMSN